MAGDRLGVESAIGWISVFLRAGAAHGERRHGRHGAVIGDAGDDAQPGPAMSAIGERIAEAALERIGDLGSARRADGGVRRDLGMRGARFAFGDAECGRQSAAIGMCFDRVDARQGRRLARYSGEEVVDRRSLAAHPHQHSFGVVQHFAGKIEFARHAPHRRAKADPLDAAAHPYLHREIVRIRRKFACSRHAARSHRRTQLLSELAIASTSPEAATR